jgi:tRNA nucleotidyltransferase/poly(A) polymerase
MIVHQTNYLEVFFDEINSLFIQNWKKLPENNEVFKEEMLEFVKKYQELNPSKALWLHKHFSLQLDQDIHGWTKNNVV